MSTSAVQQVMQTCLIGGTYICLSAGLINFNKYMLDEARFPHALELTTVHMSVTALYSLCLSFLVPSIYPTMSMSWEKKETTLKYIAPMALAFAISLVASNQAYQYCSVAFLQFCKEGNVALVFILGCALGMQVFSWKKLAVLSVVMSGCSLCIDGEINFVLIGFLLQISSQVMECCKNLIGEMVMSGAGMKLDPLTFVFWQAPCCLLPLLAATCFTTQPQVLVDFKANLLLLLANATLAFMLNVMIALTLKKLSALAFVIIGLVKDIVIVVASSAMFGDSISKMQQLGFAVTLFGVALWANLKMQEQATKAKSEEADPLLKKEHKLSLDARKETA